MGWGTFIAGRILRDRPARPSLMEQASKSIQTNRFNREKNILQEINYLQSHGKEVNMEIAKANVRYMQKAYRSLGPRLEIYVLKESQKRMLAGETVNYAEIEREILFSYRNYTWGTRKYPWGDKPLQWGEVLQWIFIPYVPLAVILYKRFAAKKDFPRDSSN